MEDNKKTYSEVLGVLLALGNKYVKRLPDDMLPYLMKNCDIHNIPQIDRNKRIEEQNISEDARILLTMIKLKYWCDSEEEKNEIINILKDNEKQYQEELTKKYDIDKIFESKNSKVAKKDINLESTEKSLVKEKKISFFQKLFKKIKSLFK